MTTDALALSMVARHVAALLAASKEADNANV